jgi:general secretion pathway protein G
MIVSKGVQRDDGAFTLVELISVIAIIAIMVTIAIPAYSSYILKAQIMRTIAEIRMLEKSIACYGADKVISANLQSDAEPSEAAIPLEPANPSKPDKPSKPVSPSKPADPTNDKTDPGLPDSLAVLGYGNLLDPWGHPYQYLKIAGGDVNGKGKLRRDRFLNPLNTDYDLYSLGPDGDSKTNLNAKESRDDIVRANSGAFIGVASDF